MRAPHNNSFKPMPLKGKGDRVKGTEAINCAKGWGPRCNVGRFDQAVRDGENRGQSSFSEQWLNWPLLRNRYLTAEQRD